jgi:hypothetical protein
MPNEMNLGGMQPSQLFETLQKQGLSSGDASILVGEWILQNAGVGKRTFGYATPLLDHDPACKAQFTRSFKHQDWIDGESVVQAGKTTAEEGFNERLHRIENDLDGLARDTATALTCITDLRKTLAGLLTEIQTAINLTNNDVFECCNARPQTFVPPNLTPNYAFTQPDYLGTTKFFDKNVMVWKTPQGISVMPAVATVNVGAGSDPRVQRTHDLAAFVATHPDIGTAFREGGMTKEQFVAKFGGVPLDGGRTVKDLVVILPDGSHFATADALVSDVAEREAGAIRTSGGADAIRAGSFSDLGAGITSVANAPIDKYEALPAETRAALKAGGIDTVGKLGAANPDQLRQILGRQGVTASAGEIAGVIATAKTIGMVG